MTEASPIKRHRSTKAEVGARREALLDIVSEMQPMTVRQVFYQATVRNIVEKSEAGYTKVQTDLVQMRRGLSVMSWHCHLSQIGRNKSKPTRDKAAPSALIGAGASFNDSIPFAPCFT